MFKLTQDVEKEKVFRRAARRYSTPGLIHCQSSLEMNTKTQPTFVLSLFSDIVCQRNKKTSRRIEKHTESEEAAKKEIREKVFFEFSWGWASRDFMLRVDNVLLPVSFFALCFIALDSK